MNSRILASLAAAAALVLANCASTPQSRIAKNPEIYNALPADQKALVSQGRIAEGLPKGGVFLAWGRPNAVRAGSDKGKKSERWFYNGYDVVWTQHFGYSTHYDRHRDHYHRHSAPYVEQVANYIPYVAGEVRFTEDRVTGWEKGR
jgi:hypothetical protein